jgi:hypothetical protein
MSIGGRYSPIECLLATRPGHNSTQMPKFDGFQRWRPDRRTYFEVIDSILHSAYGHMAGDRPKPDTDPRDVLARLATAPKKSYHQSVTSGDNASGPRIAQNQRHCPAQTGNEQGAR